MKDNFTMASWLVTTKSLYILKNTTSINVFYILQIEILIQ